MAILYIRYVVANSAVVWHSSMTVVDNVAIERIQKVAFIIILRENYESYDQALKIIGLPSLKERRIIFCKKKETRNILCSDCQHRKTSKFYNTLYAVPSEQNVHIISLCLQT